MTAAIETVGLTKTYGEVRALDGLDLVVDEGSIFGFLGPNGAGKTTTVRILTGLARPTAGVVKVLGSPVRVGNTVGTGMGYLPDVPGFYDWMTRGSFSGSRGVSSTSPNHSFRVGWRCSSTSLDWSMLRPGSVVTRAA